LPTVNLPIAEWFFGAMTEHKLTSAIDNRQW
jgi:hypothetical protein